MRLRLRGALLLVFAALAAAAPVTGRQAMQAHAEDGGGGSGSDGGSGGDGGGSDDGGDDHGGSGSGGPGSGGAQGGRGSGQQQGQPSSQRDGDLAVRLKGRIAPIREVEAIAGRTVPGEIIDIRLYRDRKTYVYRVNVMKPDGSVYDVRIDAVTRKLLSARER